MLNIAPGTHAMRATILAAAGLAAAAASREAPTLIDIVVAEDTPYACLRVPSAVSLPGDPRILVFLEARKGSCEDQAPKDIVLCESSDNGTTWSAPRVVVGSTVALSNQTYRNPYAGFAHDGTLLLQFVNSTLDEPWTSLWQSSADMGQSWGPIQRAGLPLQALDGVLAGPGSSITLGKWSSRSNYSGRIVSCGATGYHDGHSMLAALWFSDDNGVTWKMSTPTFDGMAECQPAELRDGTLMVTFRAKHKNKTCDCRAHSVSANGGETWRPSLTWDPQLIEPVCSAGLLATKWGLFFSNPASRSKRVDMTLRWSQDEGRTWPESELVWGGPSAYSTLVELPSGVGVVFERGDKSTYQKITFSLHQGVMPDSGAAL